MEREIAEQNAAMETEEDKSQPTPSETREQELIDAILNIRRKRS